MKASFHDQIQLFETKGTESQIIELRQIKRGKRNELSDREPVARIRLLLWAEHMIVIVIVMAMAVIFVVYVYHIS